MELSRSCDEVRSALPLFVGGDLDASDLRAIERHLASCGACRGELERLSAARAALLGLRSEPEVELDLWAGLRERMIEEGILTGSPRSKPGQVRPVDAMRRRRARRIAAAAMLTIGAALLVADGLRREDSPGRGVDLALPDAGAVIPREGALARPVALRPFAVEDWPLEELLGPVSEPLLEVVPGSALPPGALPASYPGGIR